MRNVLSPHVLIRFLVAMEIDYGILNWGICAYSLAWILLLLLLAELKKLIVNALLWSL